VAQARRACVALLRGDLDDAVERIESAAEFGERIHEPEAALARMALRLELVRREVTRRADFVSQMRR
jgi:hypothetical protein